MSKSKNKQKPVTNKDRDNAINNLIGNQNWFHNQVELLGKLLDAYINFKGATAEFTEHLQKLRKEFEDSQKEAKDDQKADGKSDEKVVEASSQDS